MRTTLPLVLIPLPLYILALWYCHSHFYRDPGSVFFKPEVAYEPVYTKIRLQEARSYVEELGSVPHRRQNGSIAPFLCIGVPTVAREDVRYFRDCVGSLFEGLERSERQEIYFIPFFADSDPNKHPAYRETWLQNIADSVLTHDQLETDLDVIKPLEKDGMHIEKGLLDYRLLLDRCASTGAEYVAMIEDDVISLRGWFPKMEQALVEAERKTNLRGATTFLYLRLFFTEEFLGWNSEFWPEYLFCSSLFVACTASVFLVLRVFSSACRKIMTNHVVMVICGIYAPMSIALFFAAGRMSMLGLPQGVIEMNNFGCCSQSLVYPSAQIPDLLDWYRMKKIGYVDTLTEELADHTGGLRWALVPSIMQHIGRKSTKPADNVPKAKHQLTPTEKLWNFRFELHDPVAASG